MGKATTNRVRAVRTFLSTVLAVVLTGFVYFVDQTRQSVRAFESNRAWAREVAAQVEGVSLALRERGDPNPLVNAIRSLQQSQHLVRIDRVPLAAHPPPSEVFRMDSQEQVAELVRPIFLEGQTGVRVRLRTSYPGLLGATSRASNDLTVLLVFATLFVLSFRASAGVAPVLLPLLRHRRSDPLRLQAVPPRATPPSPAGHDLTRLRESIRAFAVASRDLVAAAARLRTKAAGSGDPSETSIDEAAQELAATIPRLLETIQESQAALREIKSTDDADQSAA